MSASTLLTTVLQAPAISLGAFLTYTILRAIYNLTLHPLSKFPGPRVNAAFQLPYVLSMHSGRLHNDMKRYHDTYGPVVRLSPNELSYTDPRAWRDIYGARPGHAPVEKNRVWVKKMRPDEPESIMSPDEAVHARFRRVFVHAFSGEALKDYASAVEAHVVGLIDQLSARVERGEGAVGVEMVEWLNFLAFDISGALSLGRGFGSVETGKAHPWVEISHTFGKGLALMSSINAYPPLDRLMKYAIPEKVLERMKYHEQLTDESVAARLKAGRGEHSDFIEYITHYNNEKGGVISESELKASMRVVIFAGSETIASALSGILRLLVQHKDIMERVVAEVRQTFTSQEEISIASVAALDYTNAVIDEGMRVAPPVVIGLPRAVPAGGETICGEFVAGGTLVAFNQFAAYHSYRNFTRPDEFLPDRFLHKGEGFAGDDLAAFQPFNSGRHSCIGAKLAYSEMRLVLAQLLFTFDISLEDERDEWDWGQQRSYIFWDKKPLRLTLKRPRR